MRDVPSWDDYFFGLAAQVATRSKDPRTNVGAVLVDADSRVIALGYNGFGDKVVETAERWASDQKDRYVIHAEVNALLNAARVGGKTKNASLYVTLAPCPNCALNVIAAGVVAVITPLANIHARLTERPELRDGYLLMRQLFDEAGVAYVEV